MRGGGGGGCCAGDRGQGGHDCGHVWVGARAYGVEGPVCSAPGCEWDREDTGGERGGAAANAGRCCGRGHQRRGSAAAAGGVLCGTAGGLAARGEGGGG